METFKILLPAGPLWSDEDAKKKAPFICAAHGGKFTGVWKTVLESEMSVVECELPYPANGPVKFTLDVPAGPIWNNDDAKLKCDAICASYGGKWNGQWKTIIQGQMSVCGCEFSF
jgi:Mannan-binding protein.